MNFFSVHISSIHPSIHLSCMVCHGSWVQFFTPGRKENKLNKRRKDREYEDMKGLLSTLTDLKSDPEESRKS